MHTRQFDDLDRMTSHAHAAAGSGTSIGNISYGYDLGGRMTTMKPGR